MIPGAKSLTPSLGSLYFFHSFTLNTHCHLPATPLPPIHIYLLDRNIDIYSSHYLLGDVPLSITHGLSPYPLLSPPQLLYLWVTTNGPCSLLGKSNILISSKHLDVNLSILFAPDQVRSCEGVLANLAFPHRGLPLSGAEGHMGKRDGECISKPMWVAHLPFIVTINT